VEGQQNYEWIDLKSWGKKCLKMNKIKRQKES
jgi:hypothetical protein